MARAAGDPAGFYLAGDSLGCLLIHGFSGTPYEMRYLGEKLHAAGHTVRGVRLPGHATLGTDLYQARWRDWYAAALAGLEDLARQCDRVAVIGLSMGALLAMRLAAERHDTVRRLVLLAPALVLNDNRLRRWAPAFRFAASVLPTRWAALPKSGSDIADEIARDTHPLFPLPLRGVAELVALQRAVRPLLPRIRQPVLILHGKLDRTCPVENVEILRRELGSAQIRTRIYDTSAHILTVDGEKDEVAAEILSFVES